MSLTRQAQQWATFGRTWYLFDAKWQNPILSGAKISKYLSGRMKPIYHPFIDCGDHVVVINSKYVALPGNEWEKRVYFNHTGYPGGATWTLAWELHRRDPTMVLWKAVYRDLDKTHNRRMRMQRLHIFPDSKLPEPIMQNVSHSMQQLRSVPVRLDHIPEDVVENFPKLFEWPKEYVIK